jgi:hypothetical protein
MREVVINKFESYIEINPTKPLTLTSVKIEKQK